MAKPPRDRQQNTRSDLQSASEQRTSRPDDVADAATIERLEAIAGGADEDDPRQILDPGLSREIDKLDAVTEEEIDALRVDLSQDGGESHTTDSSGRVVDDVAEEELARFTEVGPMQPDQGGHLTRKLPSDGPLAHRDREVPSTRTVAPTNSTNDLPAPSV